ncbi:MAG: hypothetical protein ACREWG_17445, partial [Gammaproteobacteria bacterium]
GEDAGAGCETRAERTGRTPTAKRAGARLELVPRARAAALLAGAANKEHALRKEVSDLAGPGLAAEAARLGPQGHDDAQHQRASIRLRYWARAQSGK